MQKLALKTLVWYLEQEKVDKISAPQAKFFENLTPQPLILVTFDNIFGSQKLQGGLQAPKPPPAYAPVGVPKMQFFVLGVSKMPFFVQGVSKMPFCCIGVSRKCHFLYRLV